MAKAPNPQQQGAADRARDAQERARRFNDQRYVIHVGDTDVWTFTVGDVTGQHVIDLRRATGTDLNDPVVTMLRVIRFFDPSPPIDSLVELIYLARLQAGDRVTLGEVAAKLTKGTVVWVELPDEDIPDEEAILDPPGLSGS